MKGAILGDIIGSHLEFNTLRLKKSENFPLFPKGAKFTDDSVMTIATAYAILNDIDFATSYHIWGQMFPDRGYGGNFADWLSTKSYEPYNSYGNGSAMRVSPVGWLYNDYKSVWTKAEESAKVSHNHPEGIKGAVAIATCILMARYKESKSYIKDFVSANFQYDLNRTIADIRPTYQFDETCQGSVPEAIICFLEGKNYEDVVRKAVSLGGDTDTQACIAGSIAEAFYGIPDKLIVKLDEYLPDIMLDVITHFNEEVHEIGKR